MSTSKEPLDSLHRVLVLVKTAVEILAIVIAGIWAYNKYIRIEKPSELRTASESHWSWYRTEAKDKCLARFSFTIKNIGTRPFDIKEVVVQAWQVEDDFFRGSFKYLNPYSAKKTLLDEHHFKTLSESSLVGTYGAEEENSMDFTYLVDDKPKKYVLLVAKGSGEGVNIQESRWSLTCDLPKES